MSRTLVFIKLLFFLHRLTHSSSTVTNFTNINVHLLDFERIKTEVFSDSKLQNLINNRSNAETEDENPHYDDQKCSDELKAIGNGLQNRDEWSLRLLDSWGKIPSGILSGNVYELGEFSQCFHIKRDDKLYATQYCLGQFIFDLKDIIKSDSIQAAARDALMFNNWRAANEPEIMPRNIMPTPKDGHAINFGLCIPDVCSPDKIQQMLNEEAQQLLKNCSTCTFNIPANMCQFEENITQMKTADWVTIVLLALILGSIVASTCYDIWCTMNNKPKIQLFLAFSVYTNGSKLLSYERSKSADMMHCLHGIRVISTQWVVLGHTFLMYLFLPIRNRFSYIEFVSKYHNMVIMSALISVDTFFVMSGLLVSVNMLKHLEKTHGRMTSTYFFEVYMHRYLRLTPLLAISVLFSSTILRFFGNGPIWPTLLQFFAEQCERNWWSTLLYLQNYVNGNDICFGHSWYLSVDTQLYLISPFIMLFIYRYNARAIYALSFLILGCIGCTIGTFIHNDYSGNGLISDRMVKTYYPTHLRLSPWLIGVFFGYILHKTPRPIRISKLVNLLLWFVSLFLMLVVVFANYPLMQPDQKSTALEHGLYDSMSRVAWAIALCYIIFACVHGYGGPVNWFLSHPLWQPISRLCYSIYLIHFPIVLVIHVTFKSNPYFSELSAFHSFIGIYVMTIFFSVFASLAFESPIVVIEKIIFGNRHQQRPEEPRPGHLADDPNDISTESLKVS